MAKKIQLDKIPLNEGILIKNRVQIEYEDEWTVALSKCQDDNLLCLMVYNKNNPHKALGLLVDKNDIHKIKPI